MNLVKVITLDGRLRVIKIDIDGNRIGNMFVSFPRFLRVEGYTYLVIMMKKKQAAYQKSCWVALSTDKIRRVRLV